jgi:hypothetical protein
MRRRSCNRWSILVLCAALLATVAWTVYPLYIRREANSALADVQTLALASDRSATFVSLRQKYGSRLKQLEGCTPSNCSYELVVSNHLLSKFSLLPYTELNTRYDLWNGSIQTVMVEYRSAQSNKTSPVVHVQIDLCTKPCSSFYVHPWAVSTPERWNGIVEMSNDTTPELRQAALSMDAGCLARIGGCSDISQLLPGIWQPSGGDALKCVVPNHEGAAIVSR